MYYFPPPLFSPSITSINDDSLTGNIVGEWGGDTEVCFANHSCEGGTGGWMETSHSHVKLGEFTMMSIRLILVDWLYAKRKPSG